MQIKLIAMDLDGTLMLPDHQRVGETTRRALAACRQQGVRLTAFFRLYCIQQRSRCVGCAEQKADPQ